MNTKTISSLLLTLGITLGGVAQAQKAPELPPDHCAQFVPYGYPAVTEQRDVTPLCRIAYFTLHDNARKVPLYSAELLLPENVDGEAARKNNFRPDPNLPKDKRADNKDYVGSGYDRGHMAPAEDFRRDTSLMSQSFYLSNMVPQEPGLNRGVWRMLEFYIVTRVRNGESLYVITGPIFEGNIKTIGANKVAVPSALFKVIVNKERNTVESYIIPNVDDPRGSYPNYRVTLEEVSRRARVNFLPSIEVRVGKSN